MLFLTFLTSSSDKDVIFHSNNDYNDLIVEQRSFSGFLFGHVDYSFSRRECIFFKQSISGSIATDDYINLKSNCKVEWSENNDVVFKYSNDKINWHPVLINLYK